MALNHGNAEIRHRSAKGQTLDHRLVVQEEVEGNPGVRIDIDLLMDMRVAGHEMNQATVVPAMSFSRARAFHPGPWRRCRRA